MKFKQTRTESSKTQCQRCNGNTENQEFIFCPYCGLKLTEILIVDEEPDPQIIFLLEKIIGIAEKELRKEMPDIPQDFVFGINTDLEQLGCDSLIYVQIIMAIEDKLDIYDIPDEVCYPEGAFIPLVTLGDLAGAILSYKRFLQNI